MTNKKTWNITVEEAPDDSGDKLVPLPLELLEELDWNEETPLQSKRKKDTMPLGWE